LVDNQRRTLLRTLGITGTVGLSGCSQRLSEGTEDDPEVSTSPEQTPASEKTTETNQTDTTEKEPEPEIPESYRADRRRVADSNSEPENIGNYTTEQNWDNVVTNSEEITQKQQEWIDQEAYSPLVDQILNGEDIESNGRSFPNHNYEEKDPGFLDQEAVQNEDDFETLIRWYLPAIMEHDRENYGNAPSSRYQRFGVTMEKLINQHHPEAEAQATGVNSLPGHGIFGVQDENNEEFFLVDTTSSPQYDGAVGRIGDFNTSGFDPSRDMNRQNLWDPFHEFEPGPIDILGYDSKSRSGMVGLINFVEKKGSNRQVNYDKLFMTDEWMNEAYEVLRNGGSIDPIVEPIEEIIYNNIQAEEPENLCIYGTLDDTRIAVSSGDEIYEKVMKQPEPQNIENIERLLETAA